MKKSARGKMNKTTAKLHRLETKATKLWFNLALKKWKEVCEGCGEPASQMHHYIPKGRSRLLKFNVDNAVPLCQKCHYKIHFSPKPSEIARIVNKIRKGRGKKWCDYIDAKEREQLGGFYGIHYLEGVIEELTNMSTEQ